MRLAPGKKDCLILDVVGNTENELVCSPTLFGLEERVDVQTSPEGSWTNAHPRYAPVLC